MKHFTSRQMLLILGFLFPLSRMILFPASLAFLAGTSGIFTVLFCMICELAVVVSVVWVWKNTDKSFFDLIAQATSPWLAKAVAILYVLLFFVKLLLVLSSQKLMMFNVLYENVSAYILFLPVVVLLFYGGSKNSNCVARVFELSAWFVMVAFFAIMILSVPQISFENYFPLSNFGGGEVLKTAYAFPLYFGDFTFFLMFFSKVRKDFKSEWKMLFGWLFNFGITMIFILVFFGVFGELAVGGTYAISNLSKYTTSFSQIGRYDFLFILVVGFGFVVLALALFHALLSAGEFAWGKRSVWSACTALVLFFAVYFASASFEKMLLFISQYFSPFAIVLQFVLPILSPLLVLADRKKSKKRLEKVNHEK